MIDRVTNPGSKRTPIPDRMMSCLRFPRVVLCAVTTLISCDPGTDDPEGPIVYDPSESGTLGRGQFEYVCAGRNDALCDGIFAKQFPEQVAVGGSFTVRYEPSSPGTLPSVDSAAPGILELRAGALEVRRPGTVALLAVRDDELVDYVHLEAESVRNLNFFGDAGGGLLELVLQPAESTRVSAEPFGAQGTVLGGSLDYAWSSADPSIAAVETSATLQSIRVVGRNAGVTELVVSTGGFSAAMTVRVLEQGAPASTSLGSTTDSDSDSDFGTDTEGASSTDDTSESGGTPR